MTAARAAGGNVSSSRRAAVVKGGCGAGTAGGAPRQAAAPCDGAGQGPPRHRRHPHCRRRPAGRVPPAAAHQLPVVPFIVQGQMWLAVCSSSAALRLGARQYVHVRSSKYGCRSTDANLACTARQLTRWGHDVTAASSVHPEQRQ